MRDPRGHQRQQTDVARTLLPVQTQTHRQTDLSVQV